MGRKDKAAAEGGNRPPGHGRSPPAPAGRLKAGYLGQVSSSDYPVPFRSAPDINSGLRPLRMEPKPEMYRP